MSGLDSNTQQLLFPTNTQRAVGGGYHWLSEGGAGGGPSLHTTGTAFSASPSVSRVALLTNRCHQVTTEEQPKELQQREKTADFNLCVRTK